MQYDINQNPNPPLTPKKTADLTCQQFVPRPAASPLRPPPCRTAYIYQANDLKSFFL